LSLHYRARSQGAKNSLPTLYVMKLINQESLCDR
jgi:hypothetical protein